MPPTTSPSSAGSAWTGSPIARSPSPPSAKSSATTSPANRTHALIEHGRAPSFALTGVHRVDGPLSSAGFAGAILLLVVVRGEAGRSAPSGARRPSEGG